MSTELEDLERLPWWRRALPFALAAALVGYVLSSLDLHAFVHQLGAIDYAGFLGFTLVIVVATLVFDAVATGYIYRAVLGPIRFRELVLLRGASYLPGLVNHHVGQAWMTYFLSRAYGAQVWRTAGATLLVYATTIAALVLTGALSLVVDPGRFTWLPAVIAIAVAAGLVYLVVIAARPMFLRRVLTAPLLDVGVAGHLKALALRAPHIAILFLSAWVPLRFFGVDVPLGDALALVPPLLVLIALPITPQGVGTRDALAVQMFARYAVGSPEQQRAAVVATTLTWVVAMTLMQVAIALVCHRAAHRLIARGVAPAS